MSNSLPVVPSSSSSSSIVSTHSFSVKLTSKNYLAWKTQFTPILNYQDLHGFIDGSLPPPPKTIPSSTNSTILVSNPDFDSWFKKDQMLHSWLLASLIEEVFPYVIGLESSREVWNALANAFGSVSQNRQLQLQNELQELKKNDLSISHFLQKAKALSDELSAAGRPISTAEFNAIIYRNIGSDFHPIITALNIRPEPLLL